MRLDAHISRKVHEHFQFEAGGTNLLRPRHLEFGDNAGILVCNQVPRSLFVKGQMNF